MHAGYIEVFLRGGGGEVEREVEVEEEEEEGGRR